MALITIARGTLEAATQLGGRLSERLGLPLVSREDVYEAAKAYGIEQTGLGDMSFIDQRPPSVWNPYAGSRARYLACFKAALMDLALSGDFIYVGHLAHLLLSDYRPVLRVRLAAPDAYRVESLERVRGMNRAQAIHTIREVDERRLRWGQFLYGVDWRDPVLYDLVLNPEKLGLETMADAVLVLARSPELRAVEKDVQQLHDLRLAAIARAALLRNGLDLPVEARAATGSVKVFGRSPSMYIAGEAWESDLRSILSAVSEIRAVEVVAEEAHGR